MNELGGIWWDVFVGFLLTFLKDSFFYFLDFWCGGCEL